MLGKIIFNEKVIKYMTKIKYIVMSQEEDHIYGHDYIYTGVKRSAEIGANILLWFGGAFMDIVKSQRMQQLGVHCLLYYGKFALYLESLGCTIYDKNQYVKYTVDNTIWLKEQINILTSRKYREPQNCSFVHSCVVEMEQEGPSHYFETYNIHTLNEEEYPALLEKTFQSFTLNLDETKDKLFMLKYNDYYRIMCVNENNVLSDDKKKMPKLSSFKPISIVYSCNDYKIELELPNTMWCIGNDLFSPAFVRRCLEYQDQRFDFSLNYMIEIIDENVNIINITSDKYVVVEEETIDVRNRFGENESEDDMPSLEPTYNPESENDIPSLEPISNTESEDHDSLNISDESHENSDSEESMDNELMNQEHEELMNNEENGSETSSTEEARHSYAG